MSTARRFAGSATFPRQDATTSSEIAVKINAVQPDRLAKIVCDDDSTESGIRCVGIKIYPFLLSCEPLSWSPAGQP
jgi:hypothetical protein